MLKCGLWSRCPVGRGSKDVLHHPGLSSSPQLSSVQAADTSPGAGDRAGSPVSLIPQRTEQPRPHRGAHSGRSPMGRSRLRFEGVIMTLLEAGLAVLDQGSEPAMPEEWKRVHVAPPPAAAQLLCSGPVPPLARPRLQHRHRGGTYHRLRSSEDPWERRA